MLNWQCESIIVDNDNVQVEILNYFEYCLLNRITLGIICKKKKKKVDSNEKLKLAQIEKNKTKPKRNAGQPFLPQAYFLHYYSSG